MYILKNICPFEIKQLTVSHVCCSEHTEQNWRKKIKLKNIFPLLILLLEIWQNKAPTGKKKKTLFENLFVTHRIKR